MGVVKDISTWCLAVGPCSCGFPRPQALIERDLDADQQTRVTHYLATAGAIEGPRGTSPCPFAGCTHRYQTGSVRRARLACG